MSTVKKLITLKKHQADWVDNKPRKWIFSHKVQAMIQSLIDEENTSQEGVAQVESTN